MTTNSGRGVSNLGDIRRPPLLRFFVQLYRSGTTFQAMVDFVILGGLTIAFLHPPFALHSFYGKTNPAPQQQVAPLVSSPSSQPSATPLQTQAGRANDSASTSTPSLTTPNAAPPSANDISKAIANLKKLPEWPVVPVTPVSTPGLQNVPIPFTKLVTGAAHPASRFLTIDDRSFGNLPYQLREAVKAALAARDDHDGDRMRAALKDVESPEGTPELLLGLSYLINGPPESAALAEKSYRAALQKGQPQAPVLLGLLLTSSAKGLSGTADEAKGLIQSALANDRVAWLAVGNSYLSGENGTLDPVKGAPWIIKAAEAGEPVALLQYARLAEGGIGMEKNVALAEGALRRAAELGLTEAQDILGRWILAAYEKKFIDDPTEGVKLEEKVAARNYVLALGNLARLYLLYGRAPSWKDEARGVKLLQECASYKIPPCHYNLALALQFGRGIDRDVIAAWAHYDIGRQLNSDVVVRPFEQLDKTMTSSEKDEAQKRSREIMASLKQPPMPIALRRDP